jgi:hypothetical protein
MNASGAVYPPDLIELMKAVLDDATATLPEAKRTSTMKAEIASHILASAAKGERNRYRSKRLHCWLSWSVRTTRTTSHWNVGLSERVAMGLRRLV